MGCLKPGRIAALPRQFVDRLHFVGAAVTDHANALSTQRRKVIQLAGGSNSAKVGDVVATTIGLGDAFVGQPSQQVRWLLGQWALQQLGNGVQVQQALRVVQRQQGRGPQVLPARRGAVEHQAAHLLA